MKDFNIAYGSLIEGKHNFDFEIGTELFDFFNYSDLEAVDVQGYLELEKEKTLITLNFTAKGTVETICDRCGKDLILSIDSKQHVLLKFSEHNIDANTEEIIYLSPNEVVVDVAIHFYEMIVLSLPLKKVHDSQECEDEVLNFLDRVNKNEQDSMDPRWDALKKLK